MKILAWQQFLERQLREHHKTLYTVSELANVSRTTRQAVNVEITRLCRQGILKRYAQGIYGVPVGVSVEDLLALIDPCAYFTGLAALVRAGHATQVPHTLSCFTSRRPRRSRIATPFGAFVLHAVKAPIFAPPAKGHIAPAEQALCDLVYMGRQRGVVPEANVTLRRLERLRPRVLRSVLRRYPATVGEHVRRLVEERR